MTKWLKKTKLLTWDVPELRSHPVALQNVDTESLDSSIDVATSKWNLETSVECETPEGLTLDALMQSSRSGNLKRMSEGQINLPSNIGSRGSAGAMTDSMDEGLRELQSAQRYQLDATYQIG